MLPIVIELTDEQREALTPVLMNMPKGGAVFAQVYFDGIRVKAIDADTAEAVRKAIGTVKELEMHNSAFKAQEAAIWEAMAVAHNSNSTT